MDPSDFIRSVPKFSSGSHADRIRYFGWYLECLKQQDGFSGAEIGRCFDEASYHPPSSVSPFLKSLHEQKRLVRCKSQRGRYRLSHAERASLDKTLGNRPATIAVDAALVALPAQLATNAERVFLDEALICFRNGAFRASIVMAWNLAYDHICCAILSSHLAAFNTQLPKTYPKADINKIVKRDDFESLKESQVLQIAKSAGIFTGSVHKVLKEKLDRRNVAAHPSSVSIAPQTAEEFILDLVSNVVRKV